MCKNQRTSLPTKTFFSDYICHRLRRNEKTERRETEREREREKKKKEGKREKEGEREGKGGGRTKGWSWFGVIQIRQLTSFPPMQRNG